MSSSYNYKDKEYVAIRVAESYQANMAAWIAAMELKEPFEDYSLETLRKVHATLFREFPAAWYAEDASDLFNYLPSEYLDFEPGKFREPSTKYSPWSKIRKYPNTEIYTFYSCADKDDYTRVSSFLKSLDPNKIKRCDFNTKINKIVELYNEIDFFHVFQDGNSRTLRTFTAKFAESIGINLEWTKLDKQDLYAARDLDLLSKSKQYFKDNDEVMMYVEEGLRVLKERNSLDLKNLLINNKAVKELNTIDSLPSKEVKKLLSADLISHSDLDIS